MKTYRVNFSLEGSLGNIYALDVEDAERHLANKEHIDFLPFIKRVVLGEFIEISGQSCCVKLREDQKKVK